MHRNIVLVGSVSRGSAQKHFHTDAPTGRRCESAFALLSHRESNKEVALTGPVW